MNINTNPEIQEFIEKYGQRQHGSLPRERVLLDSRGMIKLQSTDFYKTPDNTDLRVWYSIFIKTNPNM